MESVMEKSTPKLLFACAVALLLGGCATDYDAGEHLRTYGPEPTASQIQAVKNELFECLFRHSQRLDDGLSDAATIAGSVASMCATQGQELVRLETYTFTNNQKSAFLREWPRTLHELAKHSVLRHRNRMNKASKQ